MCKFSQILKSVEKDRGEKKKRTSFLCVKLAILNLTDGCNYDSLAETTRKFVYLKKPRSSKNPTVLERKIPRVNFFRIYKCLTLRPRVFIVYK